MRARLLLLLPAAGLLGAAPAPAPAPPAPTPAPVPAPHQRIGAGVTAGGVDVGGLTVLQAAFKIKAEATPGLLEQRVVLNASNKAARLTGADAKLGVLATRTAQAALAAPAPAVPVGGGVPATVDVPLRVSHSHAAVRAFVARLAGKVYVAPHDATFRITLRRMVVRRAKHGRSIDVAAAAKKVDAALDDLNTPRLLRQRVALVSPTVSVADLKRNHATVVTIDKAHFTLRLFTNLRFSKSYGVAVGQPAYPTPSGLFAIQSKQVNPTWSVPNSPWAGELQGTTVSGGSAANPLKARWMGIVNGIGIHGTGEDGSIGTRASHGCIRMHVADVVALYSRVPIGTPVLIG